VVFTTSLDNFFCVARYMAAGVFSTCVKTSSGCCADPVIYERINDEMKKMDLGHSSWCQRISWLSKEKVAYVYNKHIYFKMRSIFSLFVGLLVTSVSVCMCHLYIKLNP